MRRRLPLLAAVVAGALLGAVPAAHADLTSSGTPDLRVRNGTAVVAGAGGAWQVWDLTRGRLGPEHHLRCGASQLVDWGRDAGAGGSAYVAVSLEVVEQPRDMHGNLVGLPPEPAQGPEDALCRVARPVLDPDGDGRSDPGAVAVLKVSDLGRAATALPVLRLPAGEAPSGLWVVGDDVWLAVDGGASYVRLPAGASAWGPPVPALRRPAAVDPEQTGGISLLDDGALWRWRWTEATRRGQVRVSRGGRVRLDRRPRTTFSVTNPVPGYKPDEKGACRSPRRLTVAGPAVALVDGRGRGGWGLSDGAGTWRCAKGPDGVFSRYDLIFLMRTADGGRTWRPIGRHPVGTTLVALLNGQPVFEQGASSCPRRLVVRRGGAGLREIACAV